MTSLQLNQLQIAGLRRVVAEELQSTTQAEGAQLTTPGFRRWKRLKSYEFLRKLMGSGGLMEV